MRPLRFRIQDFRSIVDTGWCTLSGDGITVLAGQNEAGKSAILMALRDFGLPSGERPATAEFTPDHRAETATPRVSVEFSIRDEDRDALAMDEGVIIPMAMWKRLATVDRISLARDLNSGVLTLDDSYEHDWDVNSIDAFFGGEDGAASETKATGRRAGGPTDRTPTQFPEDFASVLHAYSPVMLYFDTFSHTLPRSVLLSELEALAATEDAESSVLDFLALAGVDLKRVKELGEQDKALGNYLDKCVGIITGDFRSYWGQMADGAEQVKLVVRHGRNSGGQLKLDFFVRDQSDQFPDQRSRGFLWFLSFYLRLAAAEKREPGRDQVLLIDEPGTYLHARAQRDVLRLFEERLAPAQPVIYSTHSPYLLPAAGLHRVRIVVRDREAGTLVFDRLTHPKLVGEGFTDALAPIVSAIGLDVRDQVGLVREKNLVVEGISDYLYLTTWMRQYAPELLSQVNVFPATGASTVPTLCSLLTGWGFEYAVLLDRDGEGLKAAERVKSELLLPAQKVILPKDATVIEDLLSADDFRVLCKRCDPGLSLEQGERPGVAIKRLKLDKVLLARRYAEGAGGSIASTKATRAAIERLLVDIRKALAVG